MSDNVKSVISLNLRGNNLKDPGVRMLVVPGSNLINLKQIDLGRNNIGDEGVRSLAKAAILENLTNLDLYDNSIGDPGIRYLMESEDLIRIKSIDVRKNYLIAESDQLKIEDVKHVLFID